MEKRDWAFERAQMVAHLKTHGVQDPVVLAAMQAVRRHRYIPSHHVGSSPYGDHPCSIGFGQTISQPYIVAHMLEALQLQPGRSVLEIGVGCGYQAAVLAEMGMQVFGVEIIGALAAHARRVLDEEGYPNVQIRTGDGHEGWAEFAPFDGIIGACAPASLPEKLQEQLADGGRMIFPVGRVSQQLVILHRCGDTLRRTSDLAVRFVPMVDGP